MDNSNRFYDELIVEQQTIHSKLKNDKLESKDERDLHKHLSLIDTLIKNVYKYNKYAKEKGKPK